MVDLIERFSILGPPRNFVDVLPGKFGTSNNQIVRCGKLDQSTTIIVTVLMQTVTYCQDMYYETQTEIQNCQTAFRQLFVTERRQPQIV